MEQLRYRLLMYKRGRFFMAQRFDDQSLAVKQGDFFMDSMAYDHVPRGYIIEDSEFHGVIIVRKGYTIYDNDQ